MDPNYASYTYYFMKTYIVGILQKLVMCFHGEIKKKKKKPGSVAQLDPLPTGDQEVVGNILSWRLDHEMLSAVNLSVSLLQKGQLSVSGERMCTILVNCLEDQACPVKVW